MVSRKRRAGIASALALSAALGGGCYWVTPYEDLTSSDARPPADAGERPLDASLDAVTDADQAADADAGPPGSAAAIFIGGAVDLTNLTPATVQGLFAAGRGGLYTSAATLTDASASGVQGVWRNFAPYGGGLLEVPQGPFFQSGGAYDTYAKPVGWVPVGLDVELAAQVGDPRNGFTAPALTAFRSWVDAVRLRPELAHVTIAPVATPGGNDDPTYNPIQVADGHPWSESDPVWGPLAQACLYGGGISLVFGVDQIAHWGEGWPQFIESQIEWGVGRGLRTTVVFTPVTDGAFFDDVKTAVGALFVAGAIPTQWAVANLGYGDATVVSPDAGDAAATAESLNAAAQWLVSSAPIAPHDD